MDSKNKLTTVWERRVLTVARVTSVAAALLIAGVWFAVGSPSWPAPIAGSLAGALLYRLMTRKLRRRREILAQPFRGEAAGMHDRAVLIVAVAQTSSLQRLSEYLDVLDDAPLLGTVQESLSYAPDSEAVAFRARAPWSLRP